MSVQATTNLNIQQATQTASVEESTTSPAQGTTETTVHNPAAAEYAARPMGVQSGQDTMAPQDAHEIVNQVQHEILDLEIDIENIDADIAELEAQIETVGTKVAELEEMLAAHKRGELQPPLTEEQVAGLEAAIEQGKKLHDETLPAEIEAKRHERLDDELALSAKEQELELLQNPEEKEHDIDGDGIHDDLDVDRDGDGLLNEFEATIGTDPDKFDSDGDGLGDGAEHVGGLNGIGSNPLDADSTGDGLSDGIEFREQLEAMAEELGIPLYEPNDAGGASNSPTGNAPGNGGSGNGSGGGQSAGDGNANNTQQPIAPADNAQNVGFTQQSAPAAETAGTMSTSSATSEVLATQTAGDNMAIQDGEEGGEEPYEPRTSGEIREDLTSAAHYNAANTETVDSDPVQDGDTITYGDVVVNTTAGHDEILIEQDGNDIIVYIKNGDGEYKKIEIENGAFRRIFFSDLGGQDTLVFLNVDQQLIMGRFQPTPQGVQATAGIFIPSATGNNVPAGNSAESETPGGPVYSYGGQTNDPAAENPVPQPAQNTGIERVLVEWDFARNEDGTPSNSLTFEGQELVADGDMIYLQKTYTLSDGNNPVWFHHPETFAGQPIREIVVSNSADGQDLIYTYKNNVGEVIGQVVVENGVAHGNDQEWVDTHAPGMARVHDKLPNGLTDVMGYYQSQSGSGQGVEMPGVKFDASASEEAFVHVIGGHGHDWIIGSSFDHEAGGPGELFDRIEGGRGNDIIDAGTSALILGGEGDDVIKGSQFNDRIEGGSGNDAIDGGRGYNELYGDQGNDFIVMHPDATGVIEDQFGDNLTNFPELEGDGVTVNGNFRALDSLVDFVNSIDVLVDNIAALGNMDPDTRANIITAIEGWIAQGNIEKAKDEIRNLFNSVFNNATMLWGGDADAYLTGSNYAAGAGNQEEEEPPPAGEGP